MIVTPSTDLTSINGNDSNQLTLRGQFPVINSVLRSLVFYPDADASGPTSITISANDLSESYPASASDIESIDIYVVPPNTGSLDPAFANAGVVSSLDTHYSRIAVQDDGKILLASIRNDRTVFLSRFFPDGTPDIAFNTNVASSNAAPLRLTAFDLKVQSDGRILVAARYAYSSTNFGNLIARFHPDGRLDDSFSGGFVLLNTPGTTDNGQAFVDCKLEILPNSKIVLLTSVPGSSYLEKFHSDGTSDSQFGLNGRIELDRRYLLLAQATDQGFYLGSQTGIVKLVADGTVDTSFGENGYINLVGIQSQTGNIVVDVDGRILLPRNGVGGPTILAFDSQGNPDTSFGVQGVTNPAEYTPKVEFIHRLTLDASGRILAVGHGLPSDGGSGITLAVARFFSDGKLDNRFGDGGVYRSVMNVNGVRTTSETGRDVEVDDDQIYVAAQRTDSVGSDYGQVVRLIGSGNQAPTGSAIPTVQVVSHAPDNDIDLAPYFSDDWQPASTLIYSLVSNSNPSLFSQATVSRYGRLLLDYLPTARGSSTIVVRGTDAGGLFSDVSIEVQVLNAIPTTTGFADLQLKEDAPLQMVELYPSFADSTDMDEAMTYAIVDNSNPVLLTTLYIGSTGRLLLQSAANATGIALVTVQATDTVGQSVQATLRVEVGNVNDPPVISVPSIPSVSYGSSFIFDSSRPILVTDPDSNLGLFEVNLSMEAGTITLGTSENLTFSLGDGIDDESITFRGSLAAVQAGLDGLRVRPSLIGTNVLRIRVNDLDPVSPKIAQSQIPVKVSNPNAGTADTRFGTAGIVQSPITNRDDVAYAMAIQSDGKIVVGGYSDQGIATDFALQRYNADGTLDTSFGTNGLVITSIQAGDDEIRDLAIDSQDAS